MQKILILSLLFLTACTGKIGDNPETNTNIEELSRRMTPVNYVE